MKSIIERCWGSTRIQMTWTLSFNGLKRKDEQTNKWVTIHWKYIYKIRFCIYEYEKKNKNKTYKRNCTAYSHASSILQTTVANSDSTRSDVTSYKDKYPDDTTIPSWHVLILVRFLFYFFWNFSIWYLVFDFALGQHQKSSEENCFISVRYQANLQYFMTLLLEF